MTGPGRVAEQIYTLSIDIELRRQHLDQVIEEVGSIFGNAPALRCECIRSGENDPLFLGEGCPGIEKRLAVATGTVQQDDERRRGGLLRRLGNQQVIGSGFTAGAERFLRRLVGGRHRERQSEGEEACEKQNRSRWSSRGGCTTAKHAREYTPNPRCATSLS